MLKGFRDFILRGNVVDLAVAVVIGVAFSAIVNALVADIINPLIAAVVTQTGFLVSHIDGSRRRDQIWRFSQRHHLLSAHCGDCLFLCRAPHKCAARKVACRRSSSGGTDHQGLPRVPQRHPACRQTLLALRSTGRLTYFCRVIGPGAIARPQLGRGPVLCRYRFEAKY